MRSIVITGCALLSVACGHRSSEQQSVVELESEPPASVMSVAADADGVAWVVNDKDTETLKYRGEDGRIVSVHQQIVIRSVALDHDAIYWADDQHLWRAPRGTLKPEAMGDADEEDDVESLVVANGFLYWCTKNAVGRIPTKGGAPTVLAKVPPPISSRDPLLNRIFDKIAVDGTHVVASVIQLDGDAGRHITVEIWNLDGTPARVASVEAPGISSQLLVHGDTVAWDVDLPKKGPVVIEQSLRGGAMHTVSEGNLLDLDHGTFFVVRGVRDNEATFALTDDGTARQVASAARPGAVVGKRLYGAFHLAAKGRNETFGYEDLSK